MAVDWEYEEFQPIDWTSTMSSQGEFVQGPLNLTSLVWNTPQCSVIFVSVVIWINLDIAYFQVAYCDIFIHNYCELQ